MAISNPCNLLERLLREPAETPWLGFKRDYSDPNEIGQCISAFSNGAILNDRDSAFIVFGIDSEERKKVGTKARLKEKKVDGELFERWLNQRVDSDILINLEDFMHEGKWFSIMEIEQSYKRPVRFDHEEYIDIGETKEMLRDFPERERSLWTATTKRNFDSLIAKTRVNEDTVLDLLDIETLYRLLKMQRPQSNVEIMQQLEDLGAINCSIGGCYDITNLGAILLAKNITSFPSIRRKSVRIIKCAGTDKTSMEYEKEWHTGYAIGFPDVIDYLVDHLPKREEIVDGIRRTVHEYPVDAIRELVANALIHQDFTIRGTSPMVFIYQNRVEVTNYGPSLVSEDRMLEAQRSRNERLADAMSKFGLCEGRGLGLDKAIAAIEAAGLPAPCITSPGYYVSAVICGSRSFKETSRMDKIKACYLHCVLRWLQGDPMSCASLRERFRLDKSQYKAASGIIRDAIEAGRIIPEHVDQSRRNARYIPYWAGSNDA